MKTFSKTASVILALTIVQCTCGICAHAEEAVPDYSKCQDGIHVVDTTTGDTTIDVKTATAAALKDGIKSFMVAVNKVDNINSEFNSGKVYFLENGTQVAAVQGIPGVTSTVGQGNSAAIADVTSANGILSTKLPTIPGLTPVVDASIKTNDTVGIAVDNTAGTVIGKAVIGTATTPDTVAVTAQNAFGTVKSTTAVADTAVVATGTPSAIAKQVITSAASLIGATPVQQMAAIINVGRLTGTTDTKLSNSLTTTLGGKTVASITDVNDVTNTANLRNGLGIVTNQGEVKTTTTATPTVPPIVSAISSVLPTVSQNVTATADVKTTTGAATVSGDGKSISASTTLSDTAAVAVNGNTLVNHTGSATITNTVTPNPDAATTVLNNIIGTVTDVASGKTTVADAIKSAATAAIPDTITVSGSAKRTVDITFGSTGALINTSNTGNVTVSATNNTLGTASTSVGVSSQNNIVIPSASSILGGLFGGATAE